MHPTQCEEKCAPEKQKRRQRLRNIGFGVKIILYLRADKKQRFMHSLKRRNWYVPEGQPMTDFDKKVLSFQNRGALVPPRHLVLNEEQIAGIRRSG